MQGLFWMNKRLRIPGVKLVLRGWCNPWASIQRHRGGNDVTSWYGIAEGSAELCVKCSCSNTQKGCRKLEKQYKNNGPGYSALQWVTLKALQVFSSLSKRSLRSNLTEMYKHQYHKKISDAHLLSGKETAAERKTYRQGPRKNRLLYTSCSAGPVCPLSASVCLPLLPWETGSPNKSAHRGCSLL